MNLTLAVVPLAIATVDWFAVAKNRVGLRYIAKPAVIMALLVWLGMATGFREGTGFFALALVFSLAGDIALILPRERFKGALFFFSLAHIFYIFAFNHGSPPEILPAIIFLIVLAFVAGVIFRKISTGLSLSGYRKLRIPVLVYMLLITGMVFSALLTLLRTSWEPVSAVWISIGALLFFYSDASLAWNRFVQPLPNGRMKVIVSYHLAQIAIVLGTILQ